MCYSSVPGVRNSDDHLPTTTFFFVRLYHLRLCARTYYLDCERRKEKKECFDRVTMIMIMNDNGDKMVVLVVIVLGGDGTRLNG